MTKSWLKTMVGVGLLSCTAFCAAFVLSSCKEKCAHQWEGSVVIKQSTCAEQGQTEQSCANCGEKRNISLPLLEHIYEQGRCAVCDDLQTKGLVYTINDDGTAYTVSGYEGKDKEVYIVNKIEDLPVTKIGDLSFFGCEHLTDIIIPANVTVIGDSAFTHCTGLTSITIPNGVTTIMEGAFFGCLGLTDVTISESVNEIQDEAFSLCRNLININVSENNTAYQSIDGNLYTKDGKSLLQYALGKKQTSFTIPSSVETIGYKAFWDCKLLKNIMIPNSVITIGIWAFRDCTGMTDITISNGVTRIDNWAFDGCIGLTSIVIPESVEVCFGNAFNGCTRLANIHVSKNNTYLESIDGNIYGKQNGKASSFIRYAPGKTQTSFDVPDGMVWIYGNAFRDCTNLINITIPSSVIGIQGYAFYGCKNLMSIKIPDGVSTIGTETFKDCTSLRSVTMPNSVTAIGSGAFSGCKSLTSITIPSTVTTIGYRAFDGCTGLTSVTIPNSVTRIEQYAFDGCTELTNVIFEDMSTWYRAKMSNDEVQMDVNDSSVNAVNLTGDDADWYWYKL